MSDFTTSGVLTHTTDGYNYLVELADGSSVSKVKIDYFKKTTNQILESSANLSQITLAYNGEGGLDVEFTVKAEDNSSQTYRVRFVKKYRINAQ